MNKYIVKNCPALTDQGECYQGSVFMGTAFKECQERTDCVLKRIVELCDSNASKVLYEGETSKLKFVEGNPLAKKILELLEIEECE